MKDTIYIPELNLDEQKKWEAVVNRNSSFRNIFVYAVRSTGIYCLPTCPSRRPQKRQVIFFDSADEAEKAGFRPCRRCNPRQFISFDEQIVNEAVLLLEQQTGKIPTLANLSQALHISPYYLHRVFKSKIGLTPKKYAEAQRMKRFKDRVKSGEAVTTAMYDVGFGSSSRLYDNAVDRLGMTPATYRKGGKGMVINYTIFDTDFGKVLLASTEKGLCFVCFGDNDSELRVHLKEEYPAAQIQPGDQAVNNYVDVFLRYLNGTQFDINLPLDIQASTFQLRVWDALRKIPYGCTCSYADVAQAIGQPKAARAVASACASNPVALVNPCHRVVHKDGNLGGYRWGEARKRELLTRESKQT